MEQHPWAWAFFIPFIVIATFTILNLFVGIIVSTMQELATMPEPGAPQADVVQSLARIEQDVRELRARLEEAARSTARPS
jgi:voltage-gated sodium channel